MQQHWFYDVWAFIGAGGAIVMVAILMTTDTFPVSYTHLTLPTILRV